MENEQFYTVESAAERLGLAERTVQEKIREGQLKAHKQAGRYYILHSDLIAFITQ